MSFGIFNTFFGFSMYALRSTGSRERHPTPRGRATEPRLPHMAALGVPGEITGVIAKLGKRGSSKGSLPRTSCFIPGMAVPHKKMEIPVRYSNKLLCMLTYYYCCCTVCCT